MLAQRVSALETRAMIAGTPTLAVAFQSNTVSEGAFTNGLPATVTRYNANLSQALTVTLTSSDPSEATVPATVTIPAGAAYANFNLLPVDDNLLDGTQTVQITASAAGFTYASSPVPDLGLDAAYGNGTLTPAPLSANSSASFPDLVIQPDGKSIVLSMTPGSSTSWSLVRRTREGSADNSFGNSGLVTTTFTNITASPGVSPTAVALQPDGKILAVGHVTGGVTIWNDLVVVRYHSNGSLDTTFGTGGFVRIERSTHNIINDVSVLSNGSILLAGNELGNPLLVRLNPNGSFDSTFGAGGILSISGLPGSFFQLKTLLVQSDGKFIGVGKYGVNNAGFSDVGVARFLADGSYDQTFGQNGIMTIDTDPTANSYGNIENALLLADGKIVIVGTDVNATNFSRNWFVARVNANGSADTTFSQDGLVTVDFFGLDDNAYDIVVQPDGKFVAMGAGFISGNGRDLGFVRINVDGSLDTSFDGDGKLTLPNWAGTIWEEVRAGELNDAGQLTFVAGYINDMRMGQLNLGTPLTQRDLVTVTDAETVRVNIIPTTVAENAGLNAVIGTVTRSNVDDLSNSLTVNLLSSDTTELTVPATIVIPAGQASVNFFLSAVDDAIIDGSQLVTIFASAAGYSGISDTLTVTDNDANVAPVISPRSETTPEDTDLNAVVTGTDANGDVLQFFVSQSPLHGQVTMAANGAYVYTPAANYFGTDAFKYRAYDGRTYSNEATVTVTVSPVADAPLALPNSYTLNEDEGLSTSPATQVVTRLNMVSDPGDYVGGGLTYDIAPSGASPFAANVSTDRSRVTIYAGSWSLTFASPTAGAPLAIGTYLGAARWPFQGSGVPGLDVSGEGRGSNVLTGHFVIHAISFTPAGALASISATFEQHSEGKIPSLRGSIQYNNPTVAAGGVLVNDSDADSDPLSAVLVAGPAHGSLILNPNGSFDYTPDPNFAGVDSFTYSATDGILSSAPTTVTLTVNNTNDAPVIVNQSFSVNENTPNGTVVGVVTASDIDAGQVLTFSWIVPTFASAFAFNSSTGEITVIDSSLLDYEQIQTWTSSVKAFDNGTPALESNPATITINLVNINDAPVILDQSFSVPENITTGTDIGTVVAGNIEPDQYLTYAITTSSLPGAFRIDAYTGVVTVADGSLLNHEVASSVTLTVTVTDSGDPAMSASSTVTITVSDVNESPVITDVEFSVNENSSNGTVVGTVVADDPDAGDTLFYRLVPGSEGGAFAIDPVTGVISVVDGSQLNHEFSAMSVVFVQVFDSATPSLLAEGPVLITIQDVNEAPEIPPQSYFVDENSANGTSIGGVFVYEPDEGQSLSYALTGSTLPGAFAINPVTGEITVANSALLNCELRSSVTLTVRVTDSGSPALSSSRDLLVSIQNVNEAPVVTSETMTVVENATLGYIVGWVAAREPDLGQTRLYEIVSSTHPGAFAISPTTGAISVANRSLVNFEVNPTISLQVRMTDNGVPALFGEGTITIQVTNANDNPTTQPHEFFVPENSPNGTVVGQIVTTDEDPGQIHSYAIIYAEHAGAFAVNPSTGEVTVADSTLLNYESDTTMFVTVQVTDNGIPAKSNLSGLTIRVTNVNEAPVIADKTFAINENSSNGTSVGSAAASDVDAGQSLTYAITSSSLPGVFAISATSGHITVANSSLLNYEAVTSVTLSVSVTDNGNPAASSSATVTINLNDMNEYPNTGVQWFTIAEHLANGTVIGTVEATDVDAGQTLSYELTGSNLPGAFAVDSVTGAISVVDSSLINFETFPGTIHLTVKVTDNGTPVQFNNAAVLITLADVNEAPVIADKTFVINENSSNGTSVSSVTGSDVDAGQTLTYSITSSSLPGAFAINPVSGNITVADRSLLDFETVTSATLVVTVTDSGNPALSSSATVTMSITDVNELPTVGIQAYTIPENLVNGTVVGNVIASDVDAGQMLSYAITWSQVPGAFAVNATTGEITIADSSLINFESRTVIQFIVTVTDNGTPVQYNNAQLTYYVTDVNEAPVMADRSFSVAENSANGTLVGTMIGSDVDAGQTLAYSLVSSSLAGAFSINAATGAITVSNSSLLNFEATPSATLTVRVTDSGNPALSSTSTVTIALTNVNETPTIANQSFSLAENSANGTVVGTVVASDVDAGQSLAYSLVTGNTNGAFAINATTGRITVANGAALDFETTPTFSLTVRVTDNGNPALSRDAIVTVSLTDVVETLTVGLDVVPGDATNSFKRTAKFELAILSTATFNAQQVNVTTIRFGKLGTENSLTRNPQGNPIYSYRDVNGDGRLDLVVSIDASKTGLVVGDTLARFSALMTSGRQLVGSSAVIVKK